MENKQLTEHLSVVFEKKDFPQEKCEDIHNILTGAHDYVRSNIVLNIEDGLFLSFDFKEDVEDYLEMYDLLHQVIKYLQTTG